MSLAHTQTIRVFKHLWNERQNLHFPCYSLLLFGTLQIQYRVIINDFVTLFCTSLSSDSKRRICLQPNMTANDLSHFSGNKLSCIDHYQNKNPWHSNFLWNEKPLFNYSAKEYSISRNFSNPDFEELVKETFLHTSCVQKKKSCCSAGPQCQLW